VSRVRGFDLAFNNVTLQGRARLDSGGDYPCGILQETPSLQGNTGRPGEEAAPPEKLISKNKRFLRLLILYQRVSYPSKF
jgi:hypothetical protein